jgi:hypothetical protein
MGISAKKKPAKGRATPSGLNPPDEVTVWVKDTPNGGKSTYVGRLVSLNQNGFVIIRRTRGEPPNAPIAIPIDMVLVVYADQV